MHSDSLLAPRVGLGQVGGGGFHSKTLIFAVWLSKGAGPGCSLPGGFWLVVNMCVSSRYSMDAIGGLMPPAPWLKSSPSEGSL